MKNTKRALFVGRFQPFHHGHQEAIKKLLKKYEEIVVVMGSSEDFLSSENPFSCGERLEMFRSCFSKGELARLIIVPVPDVNDNTVWVDHILAHVPHFDEVYSNNQLVKLLFSKHGVLVKSIDFFDRGKKEGVYIRQLLAEGNTEWKKHVPKGVAEFLEMIDAEKRLKKIIRIR